MMSPGTTVAATPARPPTVAANTGCDGAAGVVEGAGTDGAGDGFALLLGQLAASTAMPADAAATAVAEQALDDLPDELEPADPQCPIDAVLALLSAALPVEPAATGAAEASMPASPPGNAVAESTALPVLGTTPAPAASDVPPLPTSASNDARAAGSATTSATTPAATLLAARQWLAGARGDAGNDAKPVATTPATSRAAEAADETAKKISAPFLANPAPGGGDAAGDAYASSDFDRGSGAMSGTDAKTASAALEGLRTSTSTTFEAALSALAQRVAQTAPSNQSAAPVVVDAALPPPDSAQFGDELGAKVVWMTDQKIGHAELRLSPADLGVVDVKLKLDGDQISADFHAHRAETREAIDSSIPKLRELLSQQGLQLAHAGVGGQDGRESRQFASGAASLTQPAFGGEGAADGISANETIVVARQRGLLDEYA